MYLSIRIRYFKNIWRQLYYRKWEHNLTAFDLLDEKQRTEKKQRLTLREKKKKKWVKKVFFFFFNDEGKFQRTQSCEVKFNLWSFIKDNFTRFYILTSLFIYFCRFFDKWNLSENRSLPNKINLNNMI